MVGNVKSPPKQIAKRQLKRVKQRNLWNLDRKIEASCIHQNITRDQWKGFVGKHPEYHEDWTEELKQEIKDRDNNKCQNPDCSHEVEELTVHHVNYNKNICKPKNLITLCISCNVKANTNRRYWKSFYQKVMREMYG